MQPRFTPSDVAIVSRFFTALGEGDLEAARAVLSGDLAAFPRVVDGALSINAFEGLGGGFVLACGTAPRGGGAADAFVLAFVVDACIADLDVYGSKDEALAAAGLSRVA